MLFSASVFSQELEKRQQEYARLGGLLCQLGPLLKEGSASARSWSRPSPATALQYKKTLRDLIAETVADTLRQSDKSGLSNNVVRSVRTLQGKMHERLEDLPVAITGRTKDHDVLVFAFEILQGAAAIPEPEPSIYFYVNNTNFWYLAAEAPADLSKLGMRIQSVASPVPGEIWILAQGTHHGDNRGRVYARLYAFDGASVRTVWQRDALYGGQIKTSGDRITITYYDPARWAIDPPSLEEYAITSTGLNRLR